MFCRYLLSLFIIASMVLFTGCESNVSGPEENGENRLSQEEITQAAQKLVEADHSFSIDVFKEVVDKDTSENVFISPLSISIALGMTLNGAKGETFEEMRETLAFHDLNLSEINEGYKYLIEQLTTADPKVQLEIANSVWNKLGFEVEEEFMEALREYFDAEARELDFSDPAAVDTINGWISDKTHDKIPKVLDQIPPNVVMYLINAVYFNGSWKYEFDPEVTNEQQFYLEDGESVQAELMNQQNSFAHYVSDEVQMIDLPYGDSLFTMTLLMPGSTETPLDEFISSDLTNENLDIWYQQLLTDTVGVYIPKLELEYKILLNDVLKEMGMPTAFAEQEADFTGINSKGGLFISRVLHNTYLNMDEEGTEAAGVTVVEIGRVSAGPVIPVIKFNRPYMMIIREQSSRAILFIGKIKNPAI